MNVYTQQLKNSIREKIDRIDDADYLSSLDAVLTYETYGMNDKNSKRTPLQKSFWKRLCLPDLWAGLTRSW